MNEQTIIDSLITRVESLDNRLRGVEATVDRLIDRIDALEKRLNPQTDLPIYIDGDGDIWRERPDGLIRCGALVMSREDAERDYGPFELISVVDVTVLEDE